MSSFLEGAWIRSTSHHHICLVVRNIFYFSIIPRTSKARKNIALSELCDIFLKRHFFWLRALFHFKMVELIFSEIDSLHESYCSNGPSELQRVLPDFVCALLCCLVLSISSFWLVGCLEWLCTNVPALLMKQITHECNIEKHEKDWKSAFARRKSVFSKRKRTFSRWITFIFWGA